MKKNHLSMVDPASAGLQYDKEFTVYSLDLLSGLAEGLGSGIESLDSWQGLLLICYPCKSWLVLLVDSPTSLTSFEAKLHDKHKRLLQLEALYPDVFRSVHECCNRYCKGVSDNMILVKGSIWNLSRCN
nr:uncharacterized protein LOC112493360 isoform X2 [Ziziphus jujuba var. spinosa]